SSRYDVDLIQIPATRIAFIRVLGDYRNQAAGWNKLGSLVGNSVPEDARFVTSYRANLWSFPAADRLQADIGYVLANGERPGAGLRVRTLAAGLYATTRDVIVRSNRADAWSFMTGVWVPRDPKVTARMNYFDEFTK